MIAVIENAAVYDPAPLGVQSICIVGEKIARIGKVQHTDFENAGVEVLNIDARGLIAIPGLIDPHEHLIGGSGESGFSSQTPEIFFQELVRAGITTVVGCLGVDTSTRTMPALLGKAKGLCQQGLSAYVWTGGYQVPPTTLTGSVRTDIMYIAEIIGSGETALSDVRSTQPTLPELARLVSDTYCGGILSGKAGVCHFHMGDGLARLQLVRELLEQYPVELTSIYPTHVQRNAELMDEAIDLAKRGVYVDVDTFDEDLPHWIKYYLDRAGPPDRLTISTDAAINSSATLLAQLHRCVQENKLPLECVLPMATANTAAILKLKAKGALRPGFDADVILLDRDEFAPVDVFARGRRVFADGALTEPEHFLKSSNRRVTLHGNRTGTTNSN
jgi:beta-aspartyl-dipeptidase (metallo-type)